MSRPPRDPIRPRTLWVALLAGPVIGTTYFLVVYLAAEAACAQGIDGFGTSALRTIIYASTAAGAGTLVVGALLTRRVTRAEGPDAEERATRSFLGTTGMMLAGMFLFFVALVAAPVIGSSLC